jgi:hypothetical protein
VVHNFADAWGADVDEPTRLAVQAEHLRLIRTTGDYLGVVREGVEPTGSAAVGAAALVWNLPFTLLQENHAFHIGPEGQDPVGYVNYTGEGPVADHYIVVVPPSGQPVRRAADLLPRIEEQPVELDDDQIRELIGAYTVVFAELAVEVNGLTDETNRRRGEGVLADAQQRLEPWDPQVPATAEVVMRLSHLYRRLRGIPGLGSALPVGRPTQPPAPASGSGPGPQKQVTLAGEIAGRSAQPVVTWRDGEGGLEGLYDYPPDVPPPAGEAVYTTAAVPEQLGGSLGGPPPALHDGAADRSVVAD